MRGPSAKGILVLHLPQALQTIHSRELHELPGLPRRAGGLKDTVAGRKKYTQYLDWLSNNDQAKKDAAFEKMSKGWAIATKDFKKAVISDERNRLAAIETGDKDYAEIREEQWEAELQRCKRALGKSEKDTDEDPKSADWKVAIASHLKAKHLCKNPWIAKHLTMGAPAGVSRYCSELKAGKCQTSGQTPQNT